jgi:mono/diheme cytochrome c family protein
MSVQLESADVLHEFWVPELARKITAVPGHPNHIWLKRTSPEPISASARNSAEPARLDAFPDRRRARKQSSTPGKSATSTARSRRLANEGAAKGFALFQQMSCASCHAINGTIGGRAGRPRSHAFRQPPAARRRDRRQHAGKSPPLAGGPAAGQAGRQDAGLQIHGRTAHATRRLFRDLK